MLQAYKLVLTEIDFDDELVRKAAKQAAIWGGSSLAATTVGKKKSAFVKSPKERRHALKQFAIGALAGGLSTLI